MRRAWFRVGGPYTVTVTKAGAGADTEENVTPLNQGVSTADANLNNDVTTLGRCRPWFRRGVGVLRQQGRRGHQSRQNDIMNLPSINGNIQGLPPGSARGLHRPRPAV